MGNKILQGQFETIEDYNSTFKKVKIKVFAFGENANFSNITPKAFELAKDSIYNIPIVAKYDSDTVDEYGLEGDLQGHNTKLKKDKNNNWTIFQDTVPLGLVPESAELSFEEINEGTEDEPDIKTYVIADGCYLWMRYDASKKIEEWLNNGIVPKVSMEINPISGQVIDNYYCINSFEFEAITALGSDKTPCFSRAEIEDYSKKNFKEMYFEMVNELKEFTKDNFNKESEPLEEFLKKEDFGTSDKIEIDNSKDSANTSGSWGSVNKTSLRNNLLKASNYKSLTKEAYLIRDDNWEDTPSSTLHYPHHIIQDGKLVVHQKGCQAALSRLEQNDPNNSAAKSHLKKHYRELGMDLTNFEQGGNDVGEKLKLFEQYSMLKEEEIKELKDNLDKYSLEELKEKLDFVLISQIKNELRNALQAEKIQEYGYEYSRYWYADADIEQSVVYVEDSKDNYNVYKFNYSMNGDNAVINFESGIKQKIQFADWDQGSIEFSFVPKERFEQIVEKLNEQKSKFEELQKEYASSDSADLETIMNDMMDEMKSGMSDEMLSAMDKSIKKMKKSLKKAMKDKGMMSVEDFEEYKDLQSKFLTLESEKATLLSEKSTLETKFSTLEQENTELKTFQETTITKQRSDAENILFETFSEKLTEDELKLFKETAKDFSLEELEEKLSAFAFKKITKFESVKSKPRQKVNIVFDRNDIEIKTGKPYDDILSQYTNKE